MKGEVVKRVAGILLSVCMVVSMAGCGQGGKDTKTETEKTGSTSSADDDKIKIGEC